MSLASMVMVVAAGGLLAATFARGQEQSGLGVVPGQEFVLRLRANDDLSSSVDFERAGHGADLEGAQIGLTRAELVYGLYQPGMLSFGFRDREHARLVDLGDFRVPPVARPSDTAPHPAASVLHSLALDNRKLEYLAPPSRQMTLREGASILSILPESQVQHVRPQLGHVYLLRYRGVPETADAWGRVVAFQITELVPGEALTLRGKILPGSP